MVVVVVAGSASLCCLDWPAPWFTQNYQNSPCRPDTRARGCDSLAHTSGWQLNPTARTRESKSGRRRSSRQLHQRRHQLAYCSSLSELESESLSSSLGDPMFCFPSQRSSFGGRRAESEMMNDRFEASGGHGKLVSQSRQPPADQPSRGGGSEIDWLSLGEARVSSKKAIGREELVVVCHGKPVRDLRPLQLHFAD